MRAARGKKRPPAKRQTDFDLCVVKSARCVWLEFLFLTGFLGSICPLGDVGCFLFVRAAWHDRYSPGGLRGPALSPFSRRRRRVDKNMVGKNRAPCDHFRPSS